MLYRFREAQAAELGISTKTDRRPRLASNCQDLRQCERWRGEILREISRKVSKIQDTGLTDYEVRDLNDEINALLREKGHWETQIINLGGANYRRIGSSTFDGAGRSAPGHRGYKYFGRAKELPGVKELFEGATKHQTEIDGLKKNDEAYRLFKNQGPSYYGDLDEYGIEGEQLLKYEMAQENDGWEEAIASVGAMLGAPVDPLSVPFPATRAPADLLDSSLCREKRKAEGTLNQDTSSNKKQGAVGAADSVAHSDLPQNTAPQDIPSQPRETESQASRLQSLSSVFDAVDLNPPPVPTVEQWEKIIMELQKAALMKKYIG